MEPESVEKSPRKESDDEIPSNSCRIRPTTLKILLDSGFKSPIPPSLRTPTISDLQPLLRTEVERLVQQWRCSPQTPGTFLNPKHVTEEQERFANVFTQKLYELQEQEQATISSTISPCAQSSNSNTIFNVNLPELSSQGVANFAEILHAVQHPAIHSTPFLLYTPTALHTPSTPNTEKNNVVPQHLTDLPKAQHTDAVNQHILPNPLSITLPTGLISNAMKEPSTVQLPNGLRFEISTGRDNAQTSILKMLGIGASVPESNPNSISDSTETPTDAVMWPLQVQTSSSITDLSSQESHHSVLLTSPHDETDTLPSSIDNSIDHNESSRPLRPASSVSSSSTISQTNKPSQKDISLCLDAQDVRIDPNEQSRMRLERKRARNRDAARKCRERKLRLIKSLEKEVFALSEENKALRIRLSRSKFEVERLKVFVVNHLENDCPAIVGKVT